MLTIKELFNLLGNFLHFSQNIIEPPPRWRVIGSSAIIHPLPRNGSMNVDDGCKESSQVQCGGSLETSPR